MDKPSYFYQFLEPISKELAFVARELENSIFKSPRTMLTHARMFVENILQQVIRAENLPDESWSNLKDRIDLLNENGYLVSEIRDALHHVRQIGNQAAHDARTFRYSEALLSWESVYRIVKWYVEVYGPVDCTVPLYQDPSPQIKQSYGIAEIQERLKVLERLLVSSIKKSEKQPQNEEIVEFPESMPFETESPGFHNYSNTYI